MRQTTEYKSRRMFNLAAVLLLLSFLLFLCQLINFGVFETSAREADSLPVSIRANSQADYSRDTQALSIPPISGDILRQIIMDMPVTGDPEDRIATLQVMLSQPVPTMTPDYLFPTTPAPTRTIMPTPSRTLLPTVSKSQTPTPFFTPTKLFTPTKTPIPTRSFTPTYTAVITPTPTAGIPAAPSTDRPLATAAVPTDTPTPTPTPTELPYTYAHRHRGTPDRHSYTNTHSDF